MTIAFFIRHSIYRRRLLLLLALALTLGWVQPTQAQSVPASNVVWGSNISGQLKIPTNLRVEALMGLDMQDAASVLAASGDCVNNLGTLTCTYTYTGDAQSWTVPAGVTQATFVVDGAAGGAGQRAGGTQGTGGLGARVQVRLTVSPGQVYQLMVGGAGSVTAGGFNGGGAGGTSARNFNGSGGGGASDVRSGACVTNLSCTLADRRIIAGGGGGGGSISGNGGSGGQLGGTGTGSGNDGTPGTGGTATSGGAGGQEANGGSNPGTAGQLGLGGAGGYAGCGCGGAGGGGGGLYGGGGGGFEGGGGGGSSFGPSGATFQSGVRAGDGQIAIIYTPPDNTGPVANPTLSPVPNAAGWNNTNVTVNWNWTDDLSGIVNGPCETSSTSNIGAGTQTLTAFCADEAGNLSQASYTVKVDRALPIIRATVSPTANGFGWNNSTVTVSFNCQDQGALSGLATNTVGGNQTFSSEGANFTATNTGTCVDFADNMATAVTVGPIKIDLTKPTISAAATTQPNANGWYNSDVTVHFTCTDNLSGAFSCPADQTLSSEGTALSSTTQTVLDRALNSSAASNVVTVKIDKTAPSVLLTGVTEGATYPFGSVPTAACSTTDALSGVATQATLSVTGGNGDGSGNLTATCSGATDLAGNSAAVSVNYTVGAPTATPTATNTPTATPTNTATDTPTATSTDTPVPPTATATDTATNTPVPPTATATDTATNTPVPPTATATDTPTNTPVPPTVTPTDTATSTPVPPTATATDTATNTPVPPTATPTNTPPAAPTATPIVPSTTLYATVQQVRNTLAGLLPSGDSKTDQALQKAIAKVDQGLSPDFWQLPEGNHLSNQGEKAFHRLRDAIKELRKIKAPPAAVTSAIDTVTRLGRTLAEQAIAVATAGGNAKKLTKANKEMAKAQQDLAKQRPDLAFSHYEEAWEEAQATLDVVLAASEPEEELSADDAEHVHEEIADTDDTDETVVQRLFLPLIVR